jgi:ABC-type Fe3+-hydroxamate transport system substrate-binding protein
VSDVRDIATAAELNSKLGDLFGVPERAAAINRANARTLEQHEMTEAMTAVYLIWQNPFMAVGGDTYIHAVLERLGYKNLTGDTMRYPSLTLAEIKQLQPDQLLLSSEPFPFTLQHVEELQTSLPGVEVRLVNGEFYSWYGSRLGKLLAEGDGLTIHPGGTQNN